LVMIDPGYGKSFFEKVLVNFFTYFYACYRLFA